ncbi:hypothetical protein Hanom_Chr09g00796001 [Helianthus anomalus]
MSTANDVVMVEEDDGPLPPLKWDQGLLEQVVRGQQFSPEWDARYPTQGQTAADAPPDFITLYADFFGEGKFRLPATHYLGEILHHYSFHISQLSPMGMVRIRHFEFVCRSQENFNQPPKSFHDWMMKFFFIREEVIPVDIEFHHSAPIPKEDTKVPRGVAWYEKLLALPNRVFGDQILVAVGMSDNWPERSEDVPVLLLNGEEVALYQSAFPAFVGSMGVRPLYDGEEYWFEQIMPNFMYARVELFAPPPPATEGARIPNPRPCSEESVASSEHELKPSHDVFGGVLRDLGVEHKEKRPKRVAKKKVTVAGGAASKNAKIAGAASDAASQKGTVRFHQSNLEDFIYVADSFEELYAIGGKSQDDAAATARSSGSAGSKGPESNTTPTFVHIEETEAELEAEELIRKNASKRSHAETKTETTPPAKKVATGKPIGKKGSLRTLYTDVVTKKPDAQPKITVIPPKTFVSDEGKTREVTKADEKGTDAAKGEAPLILLQRL